MRNKMTWFPLVFFAFLCGIVQGALAQGSVRDRLMEEVRAWVAAQMALPAERVEIGPLDGRMRVAQCAGGERFDFPFSGRDLVRARCEAPVWQVFIRVAVRAPKSRVASSRALVRGHLLAESDLLLQQHDDPESKGFEERGAVLGRMLRRDVAAGAMLTAEMLEDSVRAVRVTQAIKAGNSIGEGMYRIENLPRAMVPAGSIMGALPADGARLVRDVAAGQLLRVDDVSEARRVLVARLNLSAGQSIESGFFEPGTINTRESGQTFQIDLAALAFSELARNLQAGEPLRTSDIRPAVLVRRGQPVLLTVGSADTLQVTVRTEAMQDARMGEQVQLKNPESGRVLTGIVTGRAAARGM